MTVGRLRKMVDWFAEDFGTHVHYDPSGSWVPDRHTEQTGDEQ